MSNLAVVINKRHVDNPFKVIINENRRNKKPKSKRKGGKVAGQSSEVYAFKTREEITSMINVLNKHIEEASNDNQLQIAHRNKMLFIIGINVGIRASDLRELRYSFFFDMADDGSLKFKTTYTLMPKKTKKQHKFVTLYFNNAVKRVVEDYVAMYPIEDINGYLFASRKGDEPVNASSLWRIIKQTAVEAGINQNIGSHSLRKTFGRFVYENAEDKTDALVILQHIFNHSSTIVTLKYIGLLNDDIEDAFHSLNLGIEDLN